MRLRAKGGTRFWAALRCSETDPWRALSGGLTEGAIGLQTDSALGATLQTVVSVMEGTGGKLLVFQSSPPSVGAGRIMRRDNPAAYGTEWEALTRRPEDPFFRRISGGAHR